MCFILSGLNVALGQFGKKRQYVGSRACPPLLELNPQLVIDTINKIRHLYQKQVTYSKGPKF